MASSPQLKQGVSATHIVMKSFMERTIDAHGLTLIPLHDAADFMPGERNYFDAKNLARNTTYFEQKDILVSEDDFVYPPIESFAASFEKWLAIQKHDVQAVNSLHEWKETIAQRLIELYDERDDLEAIKYSALATSKYVDGLIERKWNEYCGLMKLKSDIESAIKKIRRSEKKVVEAA